ncbi:MAG: hypothetical protein JWQ66_627 [Mucilaginibacter sp.]|nr:hypothetical protein [Mucilaginibacter sp.]
MNGIEFYNFLRQTLIPDQNLSQHGNTFIQWLYDTDLQFTIPRNNPKSIPSQIIISAKDAHNAHIQINNQWLIANGNNRGWCLAQVLNGQFEQYPDQPFV